jgi:GNAT superfamily N-acetyltransferase
VRRLSSAQFGKALGLYSENPAFFPLIAAVLEQAQDGVAYADSADAPKQVYVEHAFGFAQVFGARVPAFEQALQGYLTAAKAFGCTKVRLYTPQCPDFLNDGAHDGLRSWRQRFRPDPARWNTEDAPRTAAPKDVSFIHVDGGTVDMVEAAFGVVSRFWRTREDFALRANGVAAVADGRMVSLCYAAAVAGGRAEIDVLTLPESRHLGLAKEVVNRFNRHCLKQGVLPLWDCFTNNAASMALSRSTGFVPLGDPYPFFTINRQP